MRIASFDALNFPRRRALVPNMNYLSNGCTHRHAAKNNCLGGCGNATRYSAYNGLDATGWRLRIVSVKLNYIYHVRANWDPRNRDPHYNTSFLARLQLQRGNARI